MVKSITFLLVIILFISILNANGQIMFSNATNNLPNPKFTGVNSKAIVDVNGDGYDDIVRYDFLSSKLYVLYQMADGTFKNNLIDSLKTIPVSITVGDYNNDGKNDIFTGGEFDGITIQTNNGNGFTKQNISAPLIFTQGSNLVDINNDGLLDFFACNDSGMSQIWQNVSNNYKNVNWINFATTPISDNSGNYGSVWSDIDNDGDLDLYIAKCSIYASGNEFRNDPRRINQLFVNNQYSKQGDNIVKSNVNLESNPSGWFSEKAAEAKVNSNDQAWTADFADIDNDGDQDLFVTNHEGPSSLFENDGTGHFNNITATSKIDSINYPYQSIMRDFDNDGYVDILTAGKDLGKLFINNGNKTFTKLDLPFGKDLMYSFAVGDLNHDGFYDIYSNSDLNLNLPDKLFLNGKNSNHFIVTNLVGLKSNSKGIGAKITVYTDNNIYVKEMRAGEGYGITNSYAQIFGLGKTTKVNKIIVNWPSGIVDTFLNPSIDKYLYLKEGTCISEYITANCVVPNGSGCNCMEILKIN